MADTQTQNVAEKATLLRSIPPSVVLLVLANLSPIYGVVALGWKVFPIILLFWLENFIVGALNVAKMLLATPGDGRMWIAKAFLIPFFCVHYGLFTFVHGIFVIGLFGGLFHEGAPFPDSGIVGELITRYGLLWPVIGLSMSHLISFLLNYIGQREYLTANPASLMQQPYGRVVVLHITILGGGFLVMLLQSPIIGLLLLVGLKIGLDVRSHIREHSVGTPALPQKT